MAYYRPVRDRFLTRVQAGSPGECWPWTGGHDVDGRGRFWWNGRNVPAPRAALVLLGGSDVPPGSFVCHRCDNPPCVNPKHLYVGTPLTNVQDMLSRGRNRSRVPHPRAKGEKNHNAKLSDVDVAQIRATYTGLRGEQTALAADYGVTQALISLIVRGGYR